MIQSYCWPGLAGDTRVHRQATATHAIAKLKLNALPRHQLSCPVRSAPQVSKRFVLLEYLVGGTLTESMLMRNPPADGMMSSVVRYVQTRASAVVCDLHIACRMYHTFFFVSGGLRKLDDCSCGPAEGPTHRAVPSFLGLFGSGVGD